MNHIVRKLAAVALITFALYSTTANAQQARTQVALQNAPPTKTAAVVPNPSGWVPKNYAGPLTSYSRMVVGDDTWDVIFHVIKVEGNVLTVQFESAPSRAFPNLPRPDPWPVMTTTVENGQFSIIYVQHGNSRFTGMRINPTNLHLVGTYHSVGREYPVDLAPVSGG